MFQTDNFLLVYFHCTVAPINKCKNAAIFNFKIVTDRKNNGDRNKNITDVL